MSDKYKNQNENIDHDTHVNNDVHNNNETNINDNKDNNEIDRAVVDNIDDSNSDKRKEKEGLLTGIKKSFSGRIFRSGAYVSIISTVVILLVLIVNLIISEFDLKIDLSTQGIYTLTEDTKDYVNKMEDDVTIYYLIEAGNESPMFLKIAEKFHSLSDKITLEQKDPIQYPNFTKGYVDDEVTINSFLVVNNSTQQARYVDYNDMLVNEFDQNTFQFYTVGIDVEGKLISAIQYVTTPDIPMIYYTVGHEENEVGPVYKDTMDRMNISMQPLQTLTIDRIPEDADILLINAPKIDFSDDEMAMIKQYMASGGDAVIVMDFNAHDFANLNSLINYYGLELEKGIICEGDTNHHVPMYPHYIVPKMLEHDITKGIYNTNNIVVTPQSSGLTMIDNIRSSLTISPLMETSDKAYSKVNVNSDTLLKEEGDIDGPFYLGVLSSDTYGGVTSNLVVYTTGMIFDDNMISQFANHYLLVNTTSNLAGEMEAISVRARYLYPEPLNITQKPAMFWGALTVIVLPIIILAVGIVINVRRRKR